jgi:hypothetical protein
VRLLRLLSLLQARPDWSGAELAERRCCVVAAHGMPNAGSWPGIQIARASSLNATASRRVTDSSTASS